MSVALGTLAVGAPLATGVASAATTRAADSAGSAALGSTSYSIPSGAVYVATSGSDSASGSAGAPVRTLNKALGLVPANGTIVMRGGSYNETAPIYKTVTIQNYPGEAVWLDGSTPVSGWVKDGVNWRHDGWTTRFDHSPTYTKGAPDSTNQYWQFVNPTTAPMAAHPDQVFLDGSQLAQVSSLSKVKAGAFYLDEGSSKLYVGSDPSGKQVAASNIQQALNIRAAGVTVRGIGFRRYAPSVWHVGAITLEKPNITLENVLVTDSATTGISMQSSGVQLKNVTVQYSGMLGIQGRNADNVTMTKVLARKNNSEGFNITPVAGGAKLTVTRGITVVDSSFSDNFGHGFWEDMSDYNSVFRGTNFIGNAGDGLFLEISARAIVGDNLFANNKLDGIKVNNTSNVKIWNNTFVGNGRPLDLVQDSRRNNNINDAAVDRRISFPDPEMPWELDNLTVSNNVVGLSTSVASCLLCVEDYSYKESGESMRVTANGNVYVRSSASAPTWISLWSRAPSNPNPYTLTTLASLQSTTGQEKRGREYLSGTAVLSTGGVLASSVQDLAGQTALGLPSDVASAIGRTGGSQRLGIFDASGDITPPAPQPPTTPVPPTTPTTPTTPSGAVLAQDDFGRSSSSGWSSAEVGGQWTHPVDAAPFSVASSAGNLKLRAGDGYAARLDSISSTQTDTRVAMSASQPANATGYFVSVIGRHVSGAGDYRAKFGIAGNGSVSVWLVKVVNGSESVVASSGTSVKYSVGDTLVYRVQATGTGTTSLKAKVWKINSSEPSSWTVSGTDSTSALQKVGSVGLYAYSAGTTNGASVVLSFDGLAVRTAG